MHLCRFLRWKTGYGELYRTEAELAELLGRNEVPFRCLKTQQPWGPDDVAARPEQCAPGRRCYERSPSLDRLAGAVAGLSADSAKDDLA
jgi:hypothetical protein